MPPAPSPGSHDRRPDDGRVHAHDRAARVRFRRAVTLMLMTLLVPGSAQLVAGNRRVGRIAMRTWLLLLGAGLLVLLVGLVWHGFVFRLVSSPAVLGLLQAVLMATAVGWAALFMDAWRLGRPLTLHQRQRVAVVGMNGLLCLTVAGTLLFGAHLVSVQRGFVGSMFGDGAAAAASAGRYNVLLVGGDSGQGRWGLRPDSVNVASIDAESGRTVLFGLPRNMTDFPFAEGSVMAEQFPDGFDCTDDCYLNSVNTWAQDHPELFPGEERPGLVATRSAVEGITGLDIDYWAMVDMKGFTSLVDALGGVRLNVRDRIPVGGLGSDVTGYIEPGVRTLDGHDTLWFARAREGSDDYSRMARQKCVMSAMLSQVSPQQAVRNFSEIADAGSAMVSTNLPSGELHRFIDLALKAREHKISSLSFVPPQVNTADPDIDDIQERVQRAIDRAEGRRQAGADGGSGSSSGGGSGSGSGGGSGGGSKGAPKPQGTTGGSVGSLSEGYAANDTDDLAASC